MQVRFGIEAAGGEGMPSGVPEAMFYAVCDTFEASAAAGYMERQTEYAVSSFLVSSVQCIVRVSCEEERSGQRARGEKRRGRHEKGERESRRKRN